MSHSLSINFWDVLVKELWQVSCKAEQLKGLMRDMEKEKKGWNSALI